ncbi:MAG: hypothetical protein JKY46_03595 [Robiginitomaculum sp.]|nr:hypothetical protein [Robiginitomaculum sp.]
MEESKNGKAYQTIKKRCDDLGVKLSFICREAGVDRSILERWKSEDPKTIKTLNSINDVIEKLEQEKSENA